jgi:hypothetical protein
MTIANVNFFGQGARTMLSKGIRQIVAGVGLVGCMSTWASAQSNVTVAPCTANGITGSWVVIPIAPNRPPGSPNVFAFTSDGTITRFSPVDSGATGAWISSGDRSVAYTFVALDRNAAAEFKGTFKVRGKVTLNETCDEFAGGGSVDFFDTQGKIVQSGTFTTHATRIKVEKP